MLLNIISILLVIITLGIIIYYLLSINKKLNKKIEQEKNRFILYKKQLKELDNKSSLNKKDFEELNKLARDFFKERFNLNYSISYIELAEIFKKESYDERVQFADMMAGILYAGEKADSEEIRKLINILLDIIEDYKYI